MSLVAGERLPAASARRAGPSAACTRSRSGRRGRYLVDQRGRPFLIVGDSPQSLIVNLSLAGREDLHRRPEGARLQRALGQPALRQVHGRSSRREHLRPHPAVPEAERSLDPEPALFRARGRRWSGSRASTAWSSSSIRSRPAAGWDILQANGVQKAYAYGRFLGKALREVPEHRVDERKRLPELERPSLDALVLAVAKGIRSADPHTSPHGRAQLPGEQLARRREVATAARARRGVHVSARRTPRCSRSTTGRASSRSSWSRPATNSSRTTHRISSGDSGDTAPAGVLEPAQRRVGAVLREQVHVAVPPGLEEQPRHARQPADDATS